MDLDSHCYEMVAGAGLEPILMPRKQFIKEHKNLLNVLKSGDPVALQKEYKDQKAELEKELSGGTHRENVFKKYKVPEKPYSLKELAKLSHVPEHTLQEVYNRGIGAYKTQPSSVRLKGSFVKNVDAPMSAKLSKEQWAMSRVYSFLDGNPKHDNDLRGGSGGKPAVASCDKTHSGKTTLTQAELKDLVETLEESGDDRDTVRRVWDLLRRTLDDPLDMAVMEEVKAILATGKMDRRTMESATHLLLNVLLRVIPRLEGGDNHSGLVGGRGRASGFIMRMMAENKKKHQGDYRNPSAPKDYPSTMNQWVPFDYKRLANTDQGGENENAYGASPFIQRHFAGEPTRFVPKALRSNFEAPREGETEEQRAARLQSKAEELVAKAQELLEGERKKKTVKGFLKGRVEIARAKKVLEEKKQLKATKETGEPTAASTRAEADLYIAAHDTEKPEPVFQFLPQKGAAAAGAEAIYFCRVEDGWDSKTQSTVLKPFISAANQIKVKPGVNANTVIVKKNSTYREPYAADTYYAPKGEIEVYYKGQRIPDAAIKEVKIEKLYAAGAYYYKLGYYEKDINLTIAFDEGKHQVDKECRRFRRQRYGYGGGVEDDPSRLSVSLKELKEKLYVPYYIGYHAANAFRREELKKVAKYPGIQRAYTEKERKDDLSDIKKMLKSEAQPPIYRVLYNGKEYIAGREKVEDKAEAAVAKEQVVKAPEPPKAVEKPAEKPAEKPKVNMATFFGVPKAAPAPEKRKHTVNTELRRFPGITSKQMVDFRTRVGSPRSQNTFGELTNMGNYFGIEGFPDKYDTAEKLEPFVKKWEAAKAKAAGVNPKAWAARQG